MAVTGAFERAGMLPVRRHEILGHHSSYSGSTVIEYNYANYSIPAAKTMLSEVGDRLSRLQTALDIANTQETMELDF